MNGTILYGPGESAKRNYLLKLRSTYNRNSISLIDLKIQSIKDISSIIFALSLFDSDKRLVIIENLTKSFDLDLITNNDQNLNIVLVINQSEESKIIKQAKQYGLSILEFAGEKEVTAFAYLDYILEGKKEAFLELEKLLNNYGGLYIISMIYYGLRRNLLPLPKSTYASNKITKQKMKFTTNEWIYFYSQTLQSEFKIKDGSGPEREILTELTQKFMDWKLNS